ncbi:MAG: rhomboid family intramembrane serine protease [Bacteroidetes bacterium]|nr:rhomboid family intramembrane serine protease [Bacteroidota bacterium]
MSNVQFRSTEKFPPVVKNLIIINVLVWLAQITFDPKYNITMKGALWPIDAPYFKPYQIITSMFMHSPSFETFYHILFNMFALFMFGRILENVWGGKKFLLFYMLCGIGASAAHLIMQQISGGFAPAIGASGAVMGVLVAFAFIFPNTLLMIIPIPIPIKAKWVVLAYIALDLFGGFGAMQGDDIAHFAHLGGALTGFIILLIWKKTNRRTLY